MNLKKQRYHEYLSSGEWKYKKAQRLKLANFKCDGCNDPKGAMEVHHLTYERIGMELLTDLVVYCSECHRTAHGKEPKTEWNKYLNNEIDMKPKARLIQDIEMDKIINSI